MIFLIIHIVTVVLSFFCWAKQTYKDNGKMDVGHLIVIIAGSLTGILALVSYLIYKIIDWLADHDEDKVELFDKIFKDK